MNLDGFEEQTNQTSSAMPCAARLTHPQARPSQPHWTWTSPNPVLRTEAGQMASCRSQLSCPLILRPLV